MIGSASGRPVLEEALQAVQELLLPLADLNRVDLMPLANSRSSCPA